MKIKVFFTASSDVSPKIKQKYKKIIALLEDCGLRVSNLIFSSKKFNRVSGKIDYLKIYKSMIMEINSSDILVAEISNPSVGLGYQISYAFYQRKPVIVLYSEDKNSNPSMVIRGIRSRMIFSLKYKSEKDLEKKLLPLIEKAKDLLRVRFNLVIENKEYSFIESEANRLKISKTEYIRRLIALAKKRGLNE